MDLDTFTKRPLLAERELDGCTEWPSAPEAKTYGARTSRIHFWSWVAQLIFFIASVITFGASYRIHTGGERCVDRHSNYSPALEAVDDDYRWFRFNGTFNGYSPYKGPPTAAVLAAWDEITLERSISIDHATLLRIGAPESSVKLPDEVGGGYMAGVEMFHQIHCLKALWQNTWPDFYHRDAGNETSTFRIHLDHCADILRQKLLCDADAGLLTTSWIRQLDHPTPNFNTLHKCRKWEKLQAWAKKHEVPKMNGPIVRPADAIVLDDFP